MKISEAKNKNFQTKFYSITECRVSWVEKNATTFFGKHF